MIALTLAAPSARAGGVDGARAINAVYAQCNFGPRVPGTPAHAAARKWIEDQVKALGMIVSSQPFRTRLPLTGAEVDACNIWALPAADGPTSPALIISAHWDTRPFADRDPSGTNPPMAGANDGAAAVALALELARALRQTDLKNHVALAFWDAEDAGVPAQPESWGLGARHAAAHPPAWIGRVALGINLDMVAHEGLKLRPEALSLEAAPQAVQGLWRIGRAVAPNIFADGPAQEVIDDHLPWLERGTAFIDLIGMPYQYWHTAGDTPERCSPRIMEAVGSAVLNYLAGGSWKRLPAPTRPRLVY